MKLLQAVRVVAVAAVRRAARGLDERDVPRLGTERAQERGRVVRAGADLGVVRLHDEAAALGPECCSARISSWKYMGGHV